MKRSIKVHHLPILRADRFRQMRYRSSLQDGVIHVYVVKVGDLPPDAPTVGAALPEPAPKPDGMATCADCHREYYQADGEGCQCHVCWAASLTLGGITPPWPGGAA